MRTVGAGYSRVPGHLTTGASEQSGRPTPANILGIPQNSSLNRAAAHDLETRGHLTESPLKEYPPRRDLRISLMDVLDQIQHKIETHVPQGLEDICLAAFALRMVPPQLMGAQLRCGAWRPTVLDGPASVFHTALALLAMRFADHDANDAADRALGWLDSVHGIESHWFWRWKFRLVDRAVSFDPLKSGWPWFEGTISWVAPTAMALLAYRAFRRRSPRIAVATDMLLDRACPTGGWNAGNSVVMGLPLDPHPDFTAMALLALGPNTKYVEIPPALDYLAKRAESLCSPYSLAWVLMALAMHRPSLAARVRALLLERLLTANTLPIRTLALCALALEKPAFNWRSSQ